jgi:ribose 5-phosphate isomerase RpiB
MTRRLRVTVPISLLVVLLLVGWLVPPGAAHNSPSMRHNWRRHYLGFAKKAFYTKRSSNARFINAGEQASDAALLDGLDSGDFAAAVHAHDGSDISSGTVAEARIAAALARDNEVFGIVADNDGTGSTLDADFLDGLNSTAFATASHTHSGDDITSGTVAEARIATQLARDDEVFGIVTDDDGPASGLNADFLDGSDSSDFAAASHTHSGSDITSGTVAEARIAAALARDSEVFGIVTDSDGANSGLDADLLDGLSSTAFANASHTHSGSDITSGTVDASVIDAAIARVADVFSIVLASDGTGSTLDADLFDGLNSTAFASASHSHSGDDITSGTVGEARIAAQLARDNEVVGIVTANDGTGSGLDADLLDGMNSTAFQLTSTAHDVQWFKESADSLQTTVTSERAVFTAPAGITITDVFVEPAAAVTASDSNYATIVVSRRDATGGNKVTLASKTTQTSASGGTGNWTAFGSVSLGSLSNATLVDGQKLTIEITKSGLGVTLPVLVVQIEYTVS